MKAFKIAIISLIVTGCGPMSQNISPVKDLVITPFEEEGLSASVMVSSVLIFEREFSSFGLISNLDHSKRSKFQAKSPYSSLLNSVKFSGKEYLAHGILGGLNLYEVSPDLKVTLKKTITDGFGKLDLPSIAISFQDNLIATANLRVISFYDRSGNVLRQVRSKPAYVSDGMITPEGNLLVLCKAANDVDSEFRLISLKSGEIMDVIPVGRLDKMFQLDEQVFGVTKSVSLAADTRYYKEFNNKLQKVNPSIENAGYLRNVARSPKGKTLFCWSRGLSEWSCLSKNGKTTDLKKFSDVSYKEIAWINENELIFSTNRSAFHAKFALK